MKQLKMQWKRKTFSERQKEIKENLRPRTKTEIAREKRNEKMIREYFCGKNSKS